jgi:hypothetical protein
MRKISFKMRNIGSEKYLSYILDDDIEFDEELLDYLDDNRIPELIDIIYEEDDVNDYLTYNITGRATVSDLLSDTVNAEKILGIIKGIASGIVNLRDLGIPASYVILDKSFTYVNPVTYDVGMLCVPVESEANVNAEFKMFVKDLLVNVRYADNEDCNYVARILTMLNAEKFTVRTFYSQLLELMESAGMQVEDGFVDIGADMSVSQSTEDVSSSEVGMDDLPEYQDVSFGSDDEDDDEPEDGELPENPIFKDIDSDDKKSSSGIDMSVFDDMLEELEIDESEDEDDIDEPDDLDTYETTDESDNTAADSDVAEDTEVKSSVPDIDESETEDDGDHTEMLTSPDAVSTEPTLTEIAHTAEGVTEVALSEETEKAPELISTEDLVDNPPVIKNIKINRAKIIQKAVVDAENEDEQIDNPTEQIIASQYLNGENGEPETNMDPVTPKAETDEPKGTGSTVELTGGMNVVKDTAAEKQQVNKSVPKVMPYIVRVNTGERVMINKAVFKIGKAARGVDYHVGGNGAISKIHVIIYQREDGYYLKDNKATNPTYMNNEKLEENQEKKLGNDTTISIGGEDFLFKF